MTKTEARKNCQSEKCKTQNGTFPGGAPKWVRTGQTTIIKISEFQDE